MTVAISRAVEAGARGGDLRVDRQHRRLGRGVRGARRARRGRPATGGRRRVSGSSRRRARSAHACSRCAAASTRRSRRPGRSRSAARTSSSNSLNPDRLEGQKTAAFEIVEELGAAPDVLALPYGGGGNTARLRARVRRGRRDCRASSPARRPSARRPSPPRSGSASPRTRRGEPRRSRRSGGDVVSLTDEAILGAWRELAHERGRLLRAVVRSRPRRARARRARARLDGRLRRHGTRAEGSGDGRPARAPSPSPSIPTRTRSRPPRDERGPRPGARDARPTSAPASTAPAVALELWNELEVSEGDGERRPRPPRRASVRAGSRRPTACGSRSSTGSRASAASARARP